MSSIPVAYKFGCFCLHPSEKQLLREGKPVPLAPKVYDTLLLLLESQGRLLEKSELLNRLWPGTFVEEVGLAHAISQLRKALREGTDGASFIETVPKRGYRFVVPVEVVGPKSQETTSRVTLAVLPVENLGAGADHEYLAAGLTEEFIAVLGRVDPEHIGVIGRTSMMAYKGTTKSLAEIGRELGAGFLVESSIRGERGRVRITSKLIRARDQVLIWSASYDSEPGSVLEFQRELSTAIAQQVQVRLSPERLDGLARRQTRNIDAYDLYLRGRYFWTQLSPVTTRRALEFYTRATELDPDYALAWSGLADAYSASPINGDAPPLRMWPLARDAAARAIAAAPSLAEAQTSLGLMKFWLDWDWVAAETAFRNAIALDPSYGVAHRTLAILLSHIGRHEAALSAAQCARELDPLDFVHCALSAQVAFNARDLAAAVDFARRATVLDPEFWVGYYQLAQACEQLGKSDLAFDALQKAGQFSGGNSKAIALRGYLLAKLGRIGEAREVLNTLEAVSRERYVPPYATALVYSGLGQHDQALDWLDRAYDAHDVHLVLLSVDPKWDAFRSDGRFLALIKCCGFAGEVTMSKAMEGRREM
jgi:DNA-binding winged helix-turn-helix (wHTH) protein/Flp pilus assembly protein TadD